MKWDQYVLLSLAGGRCTADGYQSLRSSHFRSGLIDHRWRAALAILEDAKKRPDSDRDRPVEDSRYTV